MRKIIHVDLDAFYASIEQRDRPELRGKPIVVGGAPDKRGVVATASYEARRFGIHSAMPSRTALRLCPQAIFVAPRFEVYRAVSAQIMALFRRYTDLVEPMSLDEAYLDVTHNTAGEPSATRIAVRIKRDILSETQLTASAGVSYNKFIAKLASDHQKPNGLTVVPPEHASAFLEAIPIQKFYGVGPATTAKLKGQGVENGANLKRLSEGQLYALLGKQGILLYHFVRGEDDRPVLPVRERKSIGKEVTLLEDIDDLAEMERILQRLSEQIVERLIRLHLRARTVTLKVKWADFVQITRSRTLAAGVADVATIMESLYTLLAQTQQEQRKVRLLGVSVSHLLPAEGKGQSENGSGKAGWSMESLFAHLE